MWAALVLPFLLLALVLCLARIEERLFPPAPAEHEAAEQPARLPTYLHAEPYPRHPNGGSHVGVAHVRVPQRQHAHYRGSHRASAGARTLRHRDTRRPATRGGT